jgi:protein-S-isoprenylcysteine O-methyltransferase Ste14
MATLPFKEETLPAESIFQTLFIITAVAFVVLWTRNLATVGTSREKFYTPAEGAFLAISRLLLLGASLIGMLVYSIAPRLMAWSALALPPWLRWAGFGSGMAALLLFFWVLQSLGKNFSTSLTIRENQTLVTAGPYRWVRHPMYTSFVLLWIGFLLLSANWFIGLTGMVAFILAIVVRTPREEQMMIERFGDEYIAYTNRTGRYLPRWYTRKAPGA